MTKTARTVTEQQPYLRGPPSIMLGGLEGDVYFAFNLDQPAGIKLLSAPAAERLRDYIAASRSAIPSITDAADKIDQQLVRANLVKHNHRYVAAAKLTATTKKYAVWIHITNGCNSNCFYCYIPGLEKGLPTGKQVPVGTNMTREAIDNLCDRLAEHVVANAVDDLHLKFAGGEPWLAREELAYFCQRAIDVIPVSRISFGIITNGFFLTDDFADTLCKHKFNVSISIDGIATDHDQIRFMRVVNGREGTFSKILSNITRLKSIGIRPYILHTVTSKNIGGISSLFDTTIGLGCGMRLSLERGSRTVPFTEQQRIAETLVSLYRNLPDRLPATMPLQRFARFSEWNLYSKKQVACMTCRAYSAVGTNLDVASCQMRLDDPVANLRTQTLNDVHAHFEKHVHYGKLAAPETKLGACTQCTYRHTCAGGCPQHTKNVFNEIDRPSPWCFVYGKLFPEFISASASHFLKQYRYMILRSKDETASAIA